MLDQIRQAPGDLLDRPSYHDRMRVETARMNGTGWKLERSQVFTEVPDDPAWAAFAAGDWFKSIEIFESERPGIQDEAAKYEKQGSEFRRLRIVERPVSAYLQWELQSLRIVDECGMPIRVVDASSIRDLEAKEPLPELVILGDRILFEVRYDKQWKACGAKLITDPGLIKAAADEIAGLWASAEPLSAYFAREIAVLSPPILG